jgi:hypothetical protein
MKKKPDPKEANSATAEEKSIFRQVGEVIGSIGAHLSIGKDKIADFVSQEVKIVKRTVKKKLAKKSLTKAKSKKVSKKATAGKITSDKTAANQTTPIRTAKKANSKKTVKKPAGKTRPKN